MPKLVSESGPALTTVSTREFREELARYLDSGETVAITRHGQVVGYFIPAADPDRLREEWRVFQASAARLQALLVAQGVDEDELVSEFDVLRKHGRPSRA